MYLIYNQLLNYQINKIRVKTRLKLLNDLNENEALLKKWEDKDIVINDVYGDDSEQIIKHIDIIKERLFVDDQYTKLAEYFSTDPKRLCMIKNNFLKFLKAVNYLYETASAFPYSGALAPTEVYSTMSIVKSSFEEIEHKLNTKTKRL